MARQRESLLFDRLKIVVKAKGGECLKIHGHAMQKSGWPDWYYQYEGYCGFIEGKIHPNVVNEEGIQDYYLRRLGKLSALIEGMSISVVTYFPRTREYLVAAYVANSSDSKLGVDIVEETAKHPNQVFNILEARSR